MSVSKEIRSRNHDKEVADRAMQPYKVRCDVEAVVRLEASTARAIGWVGEARSFMRSQSLFKAMVSHQSSRSKVKKLRAIVSEAHCDYYRALGPMTAHERHLAVERYADAIYSYIKAVVGSTRMSNIKYADSLLSQWESIGLSELFGNL